MEELDLTLDDSVRPLWEALSLVEQAAVQWHAALLKVTRRKERKKWRKRRRRRTKRRTSLAALGLCSTAVHDVSHVFSMLPRLPVSGSHWSCVWGVACSFGDFFDARHVRGNPGCFVSVCFETHDGLRDGHLRRWSHTVLWDSGKITCP